MPARAGGSPAFQEEVPVVVGVLLVLDAEPGSRQPATCLVPGRIIVVAASFAALEILAGHLPRVDRRRQRAIMDFHGDVGRCPRLQRGGQAGGRAGPVLRRDVLQCVHAQQAIEPAPQIPGSRELLQREDPGGASGCLRRA